MVVKQAGQAQRIKLSDISVRLMRKCRVPEGKPDALKANVRKHGVLVPVILSPYDPPHLVLADGHDRYRCCMELTAEGVAGFDTVPFVVNEALDTKEKVLALLFNSEERSGRNPVDLGRYLIEYQVQHAVKSQRELAQRLQLSEPTVSRVLLPFQYGDDIVDLVARDALTISHLTAVNPLGDLPRQADILRTAAAKKLTAAATKLVAFPPKRKASKSWKYEADGLSVTIGQGMDLATFQKAWAEVREQVQAKYAATDKKALPVVSVMLGLSVN